MTHTRFNKGATMEIRYNPEKKGWEIVYTRNNFINPKMWGKSVNNKIYESWDSAAHDLDKWAE